LSRQSNHEMDAESVNNLIRNRRSVFPKQFIPGAKVPDDAVKEILENATWAPNHGHTEPWHFVVYTGEGLKKLAEFQAELYKVTAADNFNEDKYNKLKSQPLLASHIIAIGMKRSGGKIPEIEEVEAVACAVQNIYLSVSAYGFGGYWTTGGVTYIEQAKPFFGLGHSDKLLGFFYIGQVAVPSPRGKRSPLASKVTWVSS
ncbi:MAG TPA: nitroreductase, partial [Chitinophagaceae bacterium]|nr:nitroreductase [Chitinophagaceae bacterium]